MSVIQTKLEQLFKEYTELKNYIQEDSKNLQKIKEEVAEKALKLDSIQKEADLYFSMIGEKEILKIDFLELKKKLYYYIEAYKDLIEIDQYILDEFLDYSVKSVFTLIAGKKEIADKQLYEFYKKQHLDYTIGVKTYNQLIKENEGAQ